MGLFSKKKQPQMPALPQFPQPMSNKVPSYQPEFPENVSHVDDFHTSPDSSNSPALPEMKFDNYPKFPDDPTKDFPPMPAFDNPPEDEMQGSPASRSNFSRDTDKPLFIKIEDYRDSIASIELLRSKIKETEDYLEKLNDIKLAEDEEISKCRKNIDTIKQKLANVDKKLFES